MNIIENLKIILKESGLIPGEIHIDFSENFLNSFGLYSTGEAVLEEYIDGGKLIQHGFVLQFYGNSAEDFERIQNTDLIKSICDYLEDREDISLMDGENEIGYIESISTANGMLWQVPGEIRAGYTYQIQIKINYYKNSI